MVISIISQWTIKSHFWIVLTVFISSHYTKGDHFQSEGACAHSLVLASTYDKLFVLDVTAHTPSSLTSGIELQNPVAITADQERGLVFFIDAGLSQMLKKDFKSGTDTEVIKTFTNDVTPEHIAVDSVTQEVFYSDSGNKVIVIVDYDGRDLRTVLSEADGLDKPRGILLDPASRKLYYTDYGSPARISRADYSGGNIQVLQNTDIEEPTAITADFASGKLYWCDAGSGSIYVMNLDGTSRVRIHYAPGSSFYDIVLVHEHLYFNSWNGSRSNIFKMTSNGVNSTSLLYVPIQINGLASICIPDANATTLSSITTSTTTMTTSSTSPPTTITSSTSTVTSSTITVTSSITTVTSSTSRVTSSTSTMTSSTVPGIGEESLGDMEESSTVVVQNSSPSAVRGGNNPPEDNNTLIIAIAIAAGALVTIALIVGVTCCVRKRRHSPESTAKGLEDLPPSPPLPATHYISAPVKRDDSIASYVRPVPTEKNLEIQLPLPASNTTMTQYEVPRNVIGQPSDHTYVDLNRESSQKENDYDEVYQEINERALASDYERAFPDQAEVRRDENSYIHAFPHQASGV